MRSCILRMGFPVTHFIFSPPDRNAFLRAILNSEKSGKEEIFSFEARIKDHNVGRGERCQRGKSFTSKCRVARILARIGECPASARERRRD